tara:strand:+ start:208 stop:777 length:570 start_codon:yes stop_codon:yes gene_type:complete
MVICKYILFFFSIVFCTFSIPLNADFKKLDDVQISPIDFLMVKFDNFFIKNKNKIIDSNPFSVSYQEVNYYVVYEKNEHFQIFIEAVMDKHRYTKVKKYYPKNADCNVVRNRIFFNKFGYSIFRRKKNNALNEDMMREILIGNIFNLEYLNDDMKDFLIQNTKIKVQITHPEKGRFITCSGNIIDVELQ